MPEKFDRLYEDKLLYLAASGNLDAAAWSAHGSNFFMSGLAVMLASARGFDREAYLCLAETLYPGASTVEVFDIWVKRTPISFSRFLPAARRRKGVL